MNGLADDGAIDKEMAIELGELLHSPPDGDLAFRCAGRIIIVAIRGGLLGGWKMTAVCRWPAATPNHIRQTDGAYSPAADPPRQW